MKVLKQFPTKRRSSRSLWAFWMLFFTFVTAVGSTLTVSELLLLANHKVVYTSIRSANIEDRRPFEVIHEAFIDANNPVIFMGKSDIVVGRARSVTAPSELGDVIVMPRLDWEKQLSRTVLAHKNVSSLFPAQSFGVMYSTREGLALSLDDLLMLTENVRAINARIDPHFELVPVPYLLTLRSGKPGLN